MLNLNHNQIGVIGAQYLSEALRDKVVNTYFNSELLFHQFSKQTLTKLELKANEIRTEGVLYLTDAIISNSVNVNLFLFSSLLY